jgi:hypothetical protein
MDDLLGAIKARYQADPELMAAYRAAVARIEADGRLCDEKARLLPDPLTATVADYIRLAEAPISHLLGRKD